MGDSMEQPVRVMRLGALRAALRIRQSEVAARLGTAQAVIAQFERRWDFRVSTLRRYVAALGAELEISAIIGGRRVRLLACEPQEGRVAPARYAKG
jgi:predicted transcriptional regulator